jgi:hypothetical protein
MVIFTRLLILFFSTAALPGFSQNKEVIRVRSAHDFYFFQKGAKTDTISANKNDVFYMLIPPSMRCNVRIEVENGFLSPTPADTVFRLKHVVCTNYIHFYTDNLLLSEKPSVRACDRYKMAINGSNSLPDKQVITVSFYNAEKGSLLLVNHFYYR